MEVVEQIESLLETAARLMIDNALHRLSPLQIGNLTVCVRALIRTAGILIVTHIHVLSPAFQREAFHLIRDIELTIRIKGHGRL